MSAWRALLAGLAIWLLHFAVVYALPSLGDIGEAPPAALSIAHIVTTLACLAAVSAMAVTGWRKGRAHAPSEGFRYHVSALGAAMAGVAIVWQSAPAWLS